MFFIIEKSEETSCKLLNHSSNYPSKFATKDGTS